MTGAPRSRFLDRATVPHIFTLILLAALPALSMNVFLPSLPLMTEHYGTSYRVMQLSVSLYLGVNAALQVFIGPLSDRFGRRPVVLASFGVFTVASVACAVAPTIETFLLFRMIQAVGATGLVLSRAIVRDMVPQAQAASMIGYVTMGMSVVPMFGPAIGGALDETLGWQSTFWLMAALGLLVLAIAWLDLGETHPGGGRSFRDQASEYPELLSSLRFWGYVAAAAFSSGTFFAYLGGAPFVGSEVFALSPAMLGIYFGAPAVGYFLGNWISGRYSVRVGVNRMILWGTVATAAGLALAVALTMAGLGSAELFFSFMTFLGIGNGMVLPNANAGLLSVRPHLAGTASGLGGASMIGGGAALSAYAGTVLGGPSGELPLLMLMTLCSMLAVAAILFVIRRERRLGAVAAAE